MLGHRDLRHCCQPRHIPLRGTVARSAFERLDHPEQLALTVTRPGGGYWWYYVKRRITPLVKPVFVSLEHTKHPGSTQVDNLRARAAMEDRTKTEMNFDLPPDLKTFLTSLDTFIEEKVQPLQLSDGNQRFFDHRREFARTDWERGGIPRKEWEALLGNVTF